MNTQFLLFLIISLVLFVLGFIALLKQKTYIDPATNAPTEVEISNFGKMKTNYPALVFVLCGFILAVYTLNAYMDEGKSLREKEAQIRKEEAEKRKEMAAEKPELWTITGTIKNPALTQVEDFGMFGVELVRSPVSVLMEPNGRYTINVELKPGENFEDRFSEIRFTSDDGRYEFLPIYLKNEMSKKKKSDASKLLHEENFRRDYAYPDIQNLNQ